MDGYEPGPIELLVPSNRHIDVPGIVLRTGPFHEEDLCEVGGIHCTTIARTLCDLGSIDPLDDVRVAFEWAWRRGVSLQWIERTAQRLTARRRRGHFAPDARAADAQRESDLHGEGWIVRFVTDAERRSPERLRRSLLALIDARLRPIAS